jgi:hypothetical protein
VGLRLDGWTFEGRTVRWADGPAVRRLKNLGADLSLAVEGDELGDPVDA